MAKKKLRNKRSSLSSLQKAVAHQGHMAMIAMHCSSCYEGRAHVVFFSVQGASWKR
jgi:RecB family endonuclease NucS